MDFAAIPTETSLLIVHTASGRYITPQGRAAGDVEVRLWRENVVSQDKREMWEIYPVDGSGLVRFKNTGTERCLTLKEEHSNAVVFQTAWDENSRGQLWRLVRLDPAQADFVIASALNENLVISPREGSHEGETTLEVEDKGPWTDQFWRWRTPRG
ncbi:RICIN domain-containing protein [Nocardia brasiliensis]|uniref:RICIN domain-containing protein n=1 Tax=Nocardia brasiliensis TaxID=37326 RepID=UPI003673586F